MGAGVRRGSDWGDLLREAVVALAPDPGGQPIPNGVGPGATNRPMPARPGTGGVPVQTNPALRAARNGRKLALGTHGGRLHAGPLPGREGKLKNKRAAEPRRGPRAARAAQYHALDKTQLPEGPSARNQRDAFGHLTLAAGPKPQQRAPQTADTDPPRPRGSKRSRRRRPNRRRGRTSLRTPISLKYARRHVNTVNHVCGVL
eukprot:3767182-Lingulodinium_polyedra.AAC.1